MSRESCIVFLDSNHQFTNQKFTNPKSQILKPKSQIPNPESLINKSPIPNPQSPIPNPQSPITQSPIPNPQSPIHQLTNHKSPITNPESHNPQSPNPCFLILFIKSYIVCPTSYVMSRASCIVSLDSNHQSPINKSPIPNHQLTN